MEPIGDYLSRVRAELASLEMASRVQYNGRRTWGTHMYPGGCWICDAFGLVHGLLAVLDAAYPVPEGVEGVERARGSGASEGEVQDLLESTKSTNIDSGT